MTAIDTKTALTTLGSETAPGPLLVPENVSRLEAAIVAAGPDYAADGEVSIFARLEGSGLPDGPEVFAIAAFGSNIATGAKSTQAAKRVPLGVPVTSGNEILVFAEMGGTDIGTVRVGVTLEFA